MIHFQGTGSALSFVQRKENHFVPMVEIPLSNTKEQAFPNLFL